MNTVARKYRVLIDGPHQGATVAEHLQEVEIPIEAARPVAMPKDSDVIHERGRVHRYRLDQHGEMRYRGIFTL